MKPRNEEAKAPEKGLLSHRKKKKYLGWVDIAARAFADKRYIYVVPRLIL
jgi:hypothetical protein